MSTGRPLSCTPLLLSRPRALPNSGLLSYTEKNGLQRLEHRTRGKIILTFYTVNLVSVIFQVLRVCCRLGCCPPCNLVEV